jgi:hypothetical protein
VERRIFRDRMLLNYRSKKVKMIARNILQKVFLLIAVGLLAGCANASSAPPQIGEIKAEPSTTIKVGDKASLTIAVSGTDLNFEWTVHRGSLTNPTQPNVIYTAPGSPGPDIVTIRIIYNGGEIIKSITFDVVEPPIYVEPTATVTPVPENTPTLTLVPESIACDSPAVTKNLFPQFASINGQFPIYGPPNDPRFLCEGVYDIVHNKPLAVHIRYENAQKNYGWWGIATPKGYDASSNSKICFWAYAQKPNQSFRLKMKDTSRMEDGVIIILEKANQWTQICNDLTEFSDLGIKLDRLDNVNLGFEQPTGSAEIWVADFEFK